MKLKEIFDHLSYGELSQISVGGAPDGEISEENYPRILAHVNLGLTALFTRFYLKEGKVTLNLMPDRMDYKIHSDFIVGNPKSRQAVRYLVEDPVLPFKDDVLKIEVLETDKGVELPLNLSGHPWTAATQYTNLVSLPKGLVNQASEVPENYKTRHLLLKYRAKHPDIKIPLGLFDPSRVEVQLPDAYLEALCMFVASRVHSPIGMSEEGKVGNVWFTRYETECARLESHNLELDRDSLNTRMERGGWI